MIKFISITLIKDDDFFASWLTSIVIDNNAFDQFQTAFVCTKKLSIKK